jgi:hypothetical protein
LCIAVRSGMTRSEIPRAAKPRESITCDCELPPWDDLDPILTGQSKNVTNNLLPFPNTDWCGLGPMRVHTAMITQGPSSLIDIRTVSLLRTVRRKCKVSAKISDPIIEVALRWSSVPAETRYSSDTRTTRSTPGSAPLYRTRTFADRKPRNRMLGAFPVNPQSNIRGATRQAIRINCRCHSSRAILALRLRSELVSFYQV